MNTRAPAPRALLGPVAFTLAAILATIAVYVSFGGTVPLQPQGYRFTIDLPQATNLVPGSDVQVAGVKIGKVTAITRGRNLARTTVQIDSEYAPIRTGATAQMRTKTLLGEGYLALTLGPRGAPAIPDGGTLPAGRVIPTVQLDQFLGTFSPSTRASLRSFFAGLGTATRGRAGSLNDTLGNVLPLTESLAQLLAALERQRTGLSRVFASSANILSAAAADQGALQATISSGHTVLRTLANQREALAATVRALPPFLTRLHGTSQILTGASGDLDTAATELLPIAPLIAPPLRNIDTFAPALRAVFRALPATLTAGRNGLPDLRSISAAAQGGLRSFYPSSRQLLPLIQLMAAYPTAPTAPFANVSSVLNVSGVGPGGLVQQFANGLPTIWNESVGGWVHRLPSNRLNPYVKPDGYADIGSLGYIEAYDCRNLTNPDTLPPTGLGAPPCVLQGPWAFDGHSAMYPHLTESPG